MRTHSGFSVVEVLVALMLISIALLGMAGSTALAVRSTTDALRRREVVLRASSRFAQLAASGCARATSGATSVTGRQLVERWTVAPTAGGFARVTDSVFWMSARGSRTLALESAIAC